MFKVDHMRQALVMIFLLLLFQVAEGANQPLKEVSASEILAKIEKGMPAEYDHIIVTGNLDIGSLKSLPTRQTNIDHFLYF